MDLDSGGPNEDAVGRIGRIMQNMNAALTQRLQPAGPSTRMSVKPATMPS